MIFNSINFIIFFLIVTSLYFILPHKYKWFLLLVSSCYFYMAFVPIYIVILGFTIVVDFLAAMAIEQSFGKKRKLFLVFSLIANIGVLAVFKYYNFINGNISLLLSRIFTLSNPLPFLSILLPIGLSFHTFQAMSYTIEVYRGRQKAERNFGIYALYVMFYPQLVAGPIERPQNILCQFYERHSFNYKNVTSGLKLMLLGFFKKLVVADRLAIYVNSIYNNVPHHNSITLITATIFFAFQIYCDFSGYSDIAIGVARIMGFKLMTNFNRPYLSKNVSEFWRRWHISLSTWFSDYLYIPLGGNRVSIPRWYFNLMLVFLVSGLWHGANWTFIFWGLINGLYLVLAIVFKKQREFTSKLLGLNKRHRLNHFVQIIITFILCCFAWIFFRANSLTDAFLVLKKIVFFKSGKLFYGTVSMIIYPIIGILILLIIELKQEYFKQILFFENKNPYVRYFGYTFFIILILTLGVFDGGQFIYFQF